MLYGSAASTSLKKLDNIQFQALRICSSSLTGGHGVNVVRHGEVSIIGSIYSAVVKVS